LGALEPAGLPCSVRPSAAVWLGARAFRLGSYPHGAAAQGSRHEAQLGNQRAGVQQGATAQPWEGRTLEAGAKMLGSSCQAVSQKTLFLFFQRVKEQGRQKDVRCA